MVDNVKEELLKQVLNNAGYDYEPKKEMTKEQLEEAREFYFGPADYDDDPYVVVKQSEIDALKKTNTGMK